MKIQAGRAPESHCFCNTALSLSEGCSSNQHSIKKMEAAPGISNREEFNTENLGSAKRGSEVKQEMHLLLGSRF